MSELFNGDDYQARPKVSADRRRTIRRQQMIERGVHPATRRPLRAPTGEETCGTCEHAVKHDRWWKCGRVPITSGPGTDIRVGWPACDRWATRE